MDTKTGKCPHCDSRIQWHLLDKHIRDKHRNSAALPSGTKTRQIVVNVAEERRTTVLCKWCLRDFLGSQLDAHVRKCDLNRSRTVPPAMATSRSSTARSESRATKHGVAATVTGAVRDSGSPRPDLVRCINCGARVSKRRLHTKHARACPARKTSAFRVGPQARPSIVRNGVQSPMPHVATTPRSEKVARLGIKRIDEEVYFVKQGDVWATTHRVPGQPKPPRRRVAIVGLSMNLKLYHYYLDADGDITRTPRR